MNEWEEWVNRFRQLEDSERRDEWNRLTGEQQRWVQQQFHISEPSPATAPSPPPPPTKSKTTVSMKGCLIGLAIFVGLIILGSLISSLSTSPTRPRPSPRSAQTSSRTVNVPVAKHVYAKKSGVNIRGGPGTKFSVVETTARSLQPFEYLSKEGEWFKLGEGRYIHESVVLTEEEKARLDAADLMLISWSWSSEYGFATAEGQVRNISGRNLENVQAVVTWLDGNGNFITSQDAMIEYNPILAGQTSPFEVMARYNPAMKKARITFKYLFGGTIEWVNSD